MGQASGKEKGDAGNLSVDGGYLIPQGVYSTVQDYDHTVVKAMIQNRKLAPFYTGLDDEEEYAQAPYNTECPICFLHYPSPLNHTRCCSQPICTECFVQIKRADPSHTNPPSSEPAACPYCQESNFGIIYKAPPIGVLTGENRTVADVAEGADKARERAEESAEGSVAQGNKRKSFSHQDPDVITTDAIRPDWQAKLSAAEAATTRRANRRIIMRQVGDRLIPVGVSSSRLGTDIPPGSTAGPGGAIIIGENSRWGGGILGGVGGGGRERRGSRNSRRDLANILQGLGDGGADMEEIMMMEAMRLSLLEHEEEQRRQAQAQSRQDNQSTDSTQSGQEAAIPAHVLNSNSSQVESAPASTTTQSTLQQQQQQTQPRSSSLSLDGFSALAPNTAASRYRVNPQELGISNSMLAELSELVEGGLPDIPPHSSAPAPGPTTLTSAPRTIADQENTTRRSSSVFASSSPPATSTPSVGSPSRIGSNPNNPFRRLGGSTSNSPSHSRQGSALFPATWSVDNTDSSTRSSGGYS